MNPCLHILVVLAVAVWTYQIPVAKDNKLILVVLSTFVANLVLLALPALSDLFKLTINRTFKGIFSKVKKPKTV